MKIAGTRMLLMTVAIAALGGTAYAVNKHGLFSASKAESASVLALVNDRPVTAADVAGQMTLGMTKPVAVENAINRALAADAARELWPADAKAVEESAAREALAALYLRKQFGEIQRNVSDADIDKYYESTVKDELYTSHVLKYYLTQDAKDAAAVTEGLKANNAETLAKLAWVNREGDHSVLPTGVPYGLYRQVKAMQPGEVLGPWRVSDGVLFLKLEERKPGKRPELAKLRDEIRQMLAQQRLESSLKDLRAQAKIELK